MKRPVTFPPGRPAEACSQSASDRVGLKVDRHYWDSVRGARRFDGRRPDSNQYADPKPDQLARESRQPRRVPVRRAQQNGVGLGVAQAFPYRPKNGEARRGRVDSPWVQIADFAKPALALCA